MSLFLIQDLVFIVLMRLIIFLIKNEIDNQSLMFLLNAQTQKLKNAQIQKSKKYLNNQKRSNIYIAFYYKIITTEFDMFNNVNVFIDENKHK